MKLSDTLAFVLLFVAFSEVMLAKFFFEKLFDRENQSDIINMLPQEIIEKNKKGRQFVLYALYSGACIFSLFAVFLYFRGI